MGGEDDPRPRPHPRRRRRRRPRPHARARTPFLYLVPTCLSAHVFLVLIHPHLHLMSLLRDGHLQVLKLLHLLVYENIVRTVSVIR